MDARDRLRRYLEQRREMGESEFALDSMSIEDALKVMGGPAKPLASPTARPAGGSSPVADATPTDRVRRDRAAAESPPATDDWRSELRATGATPGTTPARPAASSAASDGSAVPVSPVAAVQEEGKPAATTRGTTAPAPSAGHPVDLAPGLVVAKPASPGTSDIEAMSSLDAVAEMVRRCTRCPLHQTAINGVPGEGNPDARFVVVGEAPGATEDETGRPFVGAAGQLLTKILAAINLPREDVFICNVIKHRPPGNRNPLPNEIAACSPYLVRQLELIRPGVILALGTFAAQTLLETKESIGKLRGRTHRYHGIPLIVTYHPAALLRNPAWKRPAWDDVQLARRILDSSPDARA